MIIKRLKYIVLYIFVSFLCTQNIFAGPPFNTDDPEPVPLKSWELYFSTINNYQSHIATGNAPLFEANYGIIKNMHIGISLPTNYTITNSNSIFEFSTIGLGAKYRFIEESDYIPQIAIYPSIEIPVFKTTELKDEKASIFIPLWFQKTWDKFSTYGGAGYTINNTKGLRNTMYFGWEAQYEFSEKLMIGGEVYHETADVSGDKSTTGFNIGGTTKLSSKSNFIFSFGPDFSDKQSYNAYLGIQLSI